MVNRIAYIQVQQINETPSKKGSESLQHSMGIPQDDMIVNCSTFERDA
jgi:hypothetical protein